MSETKELLTSAQKGRLERDERIVQMYNQLMSKAAETPAQVAIYEHIASELMISKSTVYNVIRQKVYGDKATNDDDQ